MIYTTQEDDMLDLICFKHYSSHAQFDEILTHNPHLTSYGCILPSGVEIDLIDIEKNESPTIKNSISLWD